VGLELWICRRAVGLKDERGNVSHTVSPRSHQSRGVTGNEAKAILNEISLQSSERPCRIFTQLLKIVNKKIVGDEKNSFIERLTEVCGTSEPAKIQRLLDISYQAAKNYLQGRLPDSYVLRTIAERTPYSINWLLTGKGDKFVSSQVEEDTPLSARQVRDLVRNECEAVINELLGSRELTQQKVVVLQSDSLRSEKVKEASPIPDRKS
jgi:hypothetical protein